MESAERGIVRDSWHSPDSSGVHDPSADNRRDHFPRQVPSVKRRVLRFRVRLGGVEGPLLLRIENRNVGDRAPDERTAAAKIETASWTGGEEVYDSGKRDSLRAMEPGDGQRERGVKSGDAERRALEVHLLFGGGVRCVIGCAGVPRAVGQRDAEGFEIGGRAQWGIHLV